MKTEEMPTEEIKKEEMKHVEYEIDMYKKTLIALEELQKDLNRIQLQYNMAFESHMVHLRNLLCFFGYRKKRDDDIVCSVNITKDITNSHKQEELKQIKEMMIIIDKTINHLTLKRTDKNIKEEQVRVLNYMHPLMSTNIKRYESELQEDTKPLKFSEETPAKDFKHVQITLPTYSLMTEKQEEVSWTIHEK